MPVDGLVLLAAFASGLLGTVHCAAMCGGIATSLAVGQRDSVWMAALPNLGRVLGYALAGAIVEREHDVRVRRAHRHADGGLHAQMRQSGLQRRTLSPYRPGGDHARHL